MQNDKINNEQHERLCAFLFGELEGADRAAFAKELAASPELQAEQSRIEASMELVKEFAPVTPVALSPGVRAGLVVAAEKAVGTPGPKLAWYRHPSLQVAAATMLAFVAFRALDERMFENSVTGDFGRRGEVAKSNRKSVPKDDLAALAPEARVDYLADLGTEKGVTTGVLAPGAAVGDRVAEGGTPSAAAEDWYLQHDRGATGTPHSPQAGSSALFLGKGGDAQARAGDVLGVDNLFDDDALDVTSGMIAVGESGAVDVPAARARLLELEKAEKEVELGKNWVLGQLDPLSDEDKTELGLLRGYFENVEVSTEQAEQGRLLAEQLEVEAELRRAIEVEREFLTIVQNCIPKPGEKPSAMYYRYWGDNGYEFPVNDNLSTFSIDVDTASYTLARRYLQEGYLPERAQIRTEEFVNYATPDLPAPTGGDVFGITMELAPSPFGPNAEAGGEHRLLRVGVRGMEVDMTERDPVALTFVVDVSGSMATGGRLELVKHSLRLLVGELDPADSIALITFNNTATRVLDMTSVGNGAAIERALYEMKTGGGTNAEGGLRLGYEEAVLAHTPGAQNRVVFLSDGVGNIGETNEQKLIADVKRARDKGIYLNTIGFGMTNHNDHFLEQLADGGDGLCNYVDGADEAQRALVDNFTGAFQTIARDVKIQVEFDKEQVLSYRQLGYENRAIADVNFRNDAVDAGEVGAGQQVVALYEVVLRDADPSNETPLATTRVRYKAPYGKLLTAAESDDKQLGANEATEIESSFYWNQASGLFDGSSIGFQKSALSAQFAEFLRRSSHAKGDSLSLLRYKLEELARTSGDAEVIELSALVQLAQPQLEPELLAQNNLRRAADDLQQFEYDCLRTSYLDGDQPEGWLVTTNATREQLREKLRIEIYEANGMDAR